jgi:SpoVK/Ycf46/Vps4 family AAA+-type ATPase
MEALASRFAFTPGQICTAARTLEGAAPTPEAFFAAARKQSVHALARFARRLPLDRDWGDLILPPTTMRHLRELAGAIEHRHTVQTGWGMRLGEGGINVMFAGASGTGKSLAAGIVARHLGLDCYKVSIPGIVSKYIGETERNLERLFQAARQSNAILFFDEADALFGKRSEVKDSHDRYANLEVAYLLQKMEEHDGVVMLATNMMANMDDAFSRRLQFVVEFPPPTEPYRERLWRLMFPPGVPLDDSVDFGFLARQFELTGGQIRTASLDAAFLAAQDGGQVTMSVLIRAVARQFAKQHRVPSPAEFQNYFPVLLERGGGVRQ